MIKYKQNEDNQTSNEYTPLILKNDNSINNGDKDTGIDRRISKGRQTALGFSYGSYVIPAFYAFFLFYNVYSFLTELNDEHIEDFPLHLILEILISVMTGVSAVSDFYTNIIATTAAPELVYDLMRGEGDEKLYEEQTYRELSNFRQKIVRGSLYVTKALAWGSFIVVGLSSADSLYEYINNLPAKIALAAFLVPLGIYYGGLLLYNKTKQHHVWITSEILQCFKGLGFYAKDKPVELIEFNLQMLSNIFYKMLTYGFVSAVTLKKFNIINPVANIVTVGVSAFLGGYQTLFTRFKPSKAFVLDTEVKKICDEDYKLFTFNRAGNLLFGLIRTVGAEYLLFRYSNLSAVPTIVLCTAVGAPLVLQNILYALRVPNTLKKETAYIGFLGGLNTFTNFMARALRAGAIMVFTESFSKFLSENGIKIEINALDSAMISMASVGVESINWHFYKDALNSGIGYWNEKTVIERNYAKGKNENFSYGRFFVRSEKEYPPAINYLDTVNSKLLDF